MNAQTQTQPETARCRCRNCNQTIEFPVEQAGQTATCPNCNLETVLFVPASVPYSVVRPRNYKWLRISLYIISGLLVAGLTGAFIWLLVNNETVQRLTGGTLGLLVGIVLCIALVWWIILWAIFPVFVYTYLRKIEYNTRALRERA